MLTIHAVGNTHAETRANPVSTKATGRRGEFDYLRGFVIVLHCLPSQLVPNLARLEGCRRLCGRVGDDPHLVPSRLCQPLNGDRGWCPAPC